MSSLLHSEENFGIVVHGGAGVMSGLSEERQQEIHKKIQETVSQAYEILEKGGSSLDAVELAVSMLEDSPLFNAGRGSVYNSDEVQEMDASIMDGKNRLSGAVASVTSVKNPIKLARKVAEETKHVLLMGEGAQESRGLGDVYKRQAQNGVCGVSSTGHGEFFIKYQVAREVCVRIEYLNQNLSDSAESIINELKELEASGGLISIDHKGNISTPFNTKGMIRGSQTNKTDLVSRIY